MSEQAEAKTGDTQLEGGAYEIIRNRLLTQGKELQTRLDRLNQIRKDTFGAIETKLLGNERVSTNNNCVPRDMVPVGDQFIFGYNVHMGLRQGMNLSDVFAVYNFKDGAFHQAGLDILTDKQFESDFHDLYKYYKDTVFAKFAIIGPHLFMKFRVGKGTNDFKTFKWLYSDGTIKYVDNRSDHEFVYPDQHEFKWKRTTRDMFRMGDHPHISIEDRVFVETVGGDLTIKVEDNTDEGSGILDEPVDNPDQTLDDAEVYYALVGPVVLLKIRPYQEKAYRYFVYNEKLQEALRIDAIQDACVLLPDDHGLIFPKGYYLLTGEYKEFDADCNRMVFEKRVTSPNGEDYLYVFYQREQGRYVLLSYNLIEQRVESPIICGGYSIFEDGKLIYTRGEDEPQKHHVIQIWQTSYVGVTYEPPVNKDTPLYKIGNKDIVRGMAECHEVLNLIHKEDSYSGLYLDIVKKITGIIDSYFWMSDAQAANLAEVLKAIQEAAGGAIDEFEKVRRIKKATAEELKRVSEKAAELKNRVGRARLQDVDEFVHFLADIRILRGELISTKERRYIDLPRVEAMETQVRQLNEKLSNGCVEFLLHPAALTPYQKKVKKVDAGIAELQKVTAARELEDQIVQISGELELLIEIVGNLKIEDATQTTRIIDSVSAIYTELNQSKAAVKRRKKDLSKQEGVAEFNAQMKLIGQGLINYLDLCHIPEKCETYLTKLMVQVEELESKFAEFDEFILQLTEKREEIYNAFESKRLQLVEERNKKASALLSAADRILNGIKNRAANFKTVNEINGYFAGDLMIEKVRNIVQQLIDMEDSVKADDIQSRMKTIREEAVRQLKDKQDLYSDGGNLIRLGNHSFTVNAQNLALTVVLRDGKQFYHLTGTNFFEEITDPQFLATRDTWDMEVLSENRDVYRAEYLAYLMLQDLEAGTTLSLEEAAAMEDDALKAHVQNFMGPRYAEGYAKGVHDHDAALLLRALVTLRLGLNLLSFSPEARACAALFWFRFCPKTPRENFIATGQGLSTMVELFPDHPRCTAFQEELEALIRRFLETTPLFPGDLVTEAGDVLFRQLMAGGAFAISKEAGEIYRAFISYLKHRHFHDKFKQSVAALDKDPYKAFTLVREWVDAFINRDYPGLEVFRDEVAGLLFCDNYDPHMVGEVGVSQQIEGFKGSHGVLEQGVYQLNYNHFGKRLSHFNAVVVPKYQAYLDLKKRLSESFAQDMRLDEFKPRVLTSFVRNKLLDTVYLPLIGDNLAKQMGAAGEGKRTDLMGMLLLISPPGYGKTTLMEYIANRLGLIFMKINGPAIGHEVTSLDPASTTHASAREELKKLNLSLEMGDNVMIYLDDIQHCNPEFLQKFISLCDGQRKIEGVYKGKTRTYDLRGRKVCVVMAGNPYTESGDKFQIPDMLANRADTYNLGDIIGDSAAAFELSYVENALTSSPVLNKLAARGQKDVHTLVDMAATGRREGVELEGNYSAEEIKEFINVLQKILRVRDVILKVNLEYIRSAAQEDAYRTEPPFKLQGSYRNMNKIVEKILPIMNQAELENLIISHYENESQTLTSGAESNLLKFRELTGNLDETQAARWAEIRSGFAKKQRFHGIDSGDKVGQVIAQLSTFSEGLESIKSVLSEGMARVAEGRDNGPVQTQMTLTRETLVGLNSILKPLLNELAKVKPPPAAAPAPSNGDVDGKQTQILLQTMRQQFNIMEHWVKPLYENSHEQSQKIAQLQGAVKASLGTHATIIHHLETLLGGTHGAGEN